MELIEVFNLHTGQTGKIRRDWFEHPVINKGVLVLAEPGQKSYVPDLYKSRVEEVEDVTEDEPVEAPETEEEI